MALTPRPPLPPSGGRGGAALAARTASVERKTAPPLFRTRGRGDGGEGEPASLKFINRICAHVFCPPLNRNHFALFAPLQSRTAVRIYSAFAKPDSCPALLCCCLHPPPAVEERTERSIEYNCRSLCDAVKPRAALPITPPPAGKGQGVGASARATGFVPRARPLRAGCRTDVLLAALEPQRGGLG